MVPTLENGLLYFGLYTNSVYALNPERGELVWETTPGDSILFSPTVDGSRVFIGSYDESLYALESETGEIQWNFETDSAV